MFPAARPLSRRPRSTVRRATRRRWPMRLVPLEDRTVPAVWFVNDDAAGANTGQSWADAYTDLQSALAAAVAGDGVWVAQGTYTPTAGTDRAISFALKTGVGVYGGFAGTETARTQRNWAARPTVLSGDIGTKGTAADNSYHVVTAEGVTATAVLDGFTVTAGNAGSSGNGGGLYIVMGSPTLTNIVVSNNAASRGGGLYNIGSPTLANVTVTGNLADVAGGGLYIRGGSPTLTDVTFTGNTADFGGGLYCDTGSPALTNVTVAGNFASYAGGLYNSGTLALTNVTVAGNTAAVSSGGLYILSFGSAALRNAVIWGNSAPTGPQIAGAGPATTTYSIVQGGWAGTGNLDADPLFVNPAAGDYRLQPGSPAIDHGANTGAPLIDCDGNRRPVDGDGDGTAVTDMGAYEYQPAALPPVVAGIQVNDDGAQRSQVRSVVVTFSGAVTFAGGDANAAAAFALTRVGGGGDAGLVATVSVDTLGWTVVTLTFTAANPAVIDPLSGQNGGPLSLTDGRYRLSILDGAVTGRGGALDGDGDGAAGGGYLSPEDTGGLGSPGYVYGLYRLFGDATGDGVVNLLDLQSLRVAFNRTAPDPDYLAFLDADNSGAIDLLDLQQFRSRFNQYLFV